MQYFYLIFDYEIDLDGNFQRIMKIKLFLLGEDILQVRSEISSHTFVYNKCTIQLMVAVSHVVSCFLLEKFKVVFQNV